MNARILEVMELEMRKNDLVAEIYHSAFSGVAQVQKSKALAEIILQLYGQHQQEQMLRPHI
jgi:hypothetical protein